MPRYTVWSASGRVRRVTVDGVEIRRVTLADTERGYVDRIVLDAKGQPVRVGDRIATERLFGRVEVVVD